MSGHAYKSQAVWVRAKLIFLEVLKVDHSGRFETTDLSSLYPDVVVALDLMADTMRAKLGDAQRGIPCTECRAAGSLP